MNQLPRLVGILCGLALILSVVTLVILDYPPRMRLQERQRSLDEISKTLDQIEQALAKKLGMTHEEFIQWMEEQNDNSNRGTDPNEEGH